MNDEILVPLDLSDAIAMIDRQKEQIAALEAAVKEKEGEGILWRNRALAVSLHIPPETLCGEIQGWIKEHTVQIAALTAENERLKGVLRLMANAPLLETAPLQQVKAFIRKAQEALRDEEVKDGE